MPTSIPPLEPVVPLVETFAHMVASFVSGILGSAVVFALGGRWYGLSPEVLLRMCAVANLAGFLGVTLTVRAERLPWVKRHLLKGGLPTWGLLSAVFLGVLFGFSPEFRDWKVALGLTFPLIFAAGFSFPAFGWLQDRLVRREQRR